MTSIELKRKINKLLNKAEDQALDAGADITSDKFQEIMEMAKAKLLEANGLTFEQFNAIGKDNKEEKLKQEREDHSKEIEKLQQTNQEIKDKVLIQTEKIKGLESLNEIEKEAFKTKLNSLKDELESTKELSLERKVLIQEDLVNLNDKLDEISINGTKDVWEVKEISKEQIQKQEQFNKEIILKNKEQEEDINLLADATNELWKKD